MDDRNGQIDMGHPLAAHFGKSHFNAATIANNPFMLDFLVFSASAFPIACRTEDLFAEKTAFFRLECAVVDRFRFFDFAARPFIADDIIRGNFDRQFIKLRILLIIF